MVLVLNVRFGSFAIGSSQQRCRPFRYAAESGSHLVSGYALMSATP
jgi:hypothetical protein